jgi:NAD(P)-dependent dehydrogenase (short-subunit alcohol dehydrogenase family)
VQDAARTSGIHRSRVGQISAQPQERTHPPFSTGERLQGKVGIVTGAGSSGPGIGTGRAIATLFAREGARIGLVDRIRGRAEETLADIQEAGGDAFVLEADVTSQTECERVVATALEQFGRIDVLVNNIGTTVRKVTTNAAVDDLEELSVDAWNAVMSVNLTSALLMTQAALPSLVAAKRGAIVNISSAAALRAYGGIAYGASKAALAQFSRDVAVRYGDFGIRCNAIAPAGIYTPFVRGTDPDQPFTAEARSARRRMSPLGIEGDAWDVAAAALFLASDEARYVTGVVLPVDGGISTVAAQRASELASERPDDR